MEMNNDQYTESQRQFIDRFSKTIVDRRLATPAIFFLESMTPLNFVASQGLAFFTPIVQIFMKAGDMALLQELLESRQFIPDFIRTIEELDRDNRKIKKVEGTTDHAD